MNAAIRSYEEVAKLDPANAEAWAFLADLYQMKKDTTRQIQALERWAAAPSAIEIGFYRAIMQNDLSADQANFQLSQFYLQQGKNQQAVAAARRAYEADPESNAYARNLITTLRMAGNSENELETYAQLEKSANSPTLQDRLRLGARADRPLQRGGREAERQFESRPDQRQLSRLAGDCPAPRQSARRCSGNAQGWRCARGGRMRVST